MKKRLGLFKLKYRHIFGTPDNIKLLHIPSIFDFAGSDQRNGRRFGAGGGGGGCSAANPVRQSHSRKTETLVLKWLSTNFRSHDH